MEGKRKWAGVGEGLNGSQHPPVENSAFFILYVILSPALSALAPSEYISILPRGEIRALGIILGTHLIGSSQ